MEMPFKCCTSNCKNGYDSDRLCKEKEGITEELHFFKFPAHKTQPQKRVKWILKVPRDDWKPKEICRYLDLQITFPRNVNYMV